ncbi:MAG TPA: hypothetical protein VD948_12750 [Rhodothermales bacterium]|nr:hypothetical protein [Rhodothermales bacterium]
MSAINKFDQTFTGNGTGQPFGLHDFVGLTVDWKTGVTAGTVTLETAPTADYSGTWATELTCTFSGSAPLVQTAAAEVQGRVGRLRVASLADGNVQVYVTEGER